MKTTLRNLDKALEEIAKCHPRIAEYFWGDWPDFFDSTKERQYPAIVCNISSPISFSQVTRIKLNIIAIDQVKEDDLDMLKEVESDTLQDVHDFYRVIKHSPNWQMIGAVENVNAPLKFKDKGADQVAGWQITIDYKMLESTGLCDLPLIDYDYSQKLKC